MKLGEIRGVMSWIPFHCIQATTCRPQAQFETFKPFKPFKLPPLSSPESRRVAEDEGRGLKELNA
jgi:hypothetical protein